MKALARSLVRALVVSAALGGLASVRPAFAAPTKVADAEYPAEFRARVRKAIELGLQYLRGDQLSGSEAGQPDVPLADKYKWLDEEIRFEEATAVTWVLRRAGLPPDEPALVKADAILRERAPKSIEEASLLLLALSTTPLPQGNPFAIESSAAAAPASAVPKEEKAIIDRAVAFVLERQVKSSETAGLLDDRVYDDRGGWGFEYGKGKSDSSDIATTFIALQSLEAAARRGATIHPRVYADALGLLVGWQAPKGQAVSLKCNEVRGADRFEWVEKAQARGYGFSGSLSDSPSGYETAGGAMGLVICQDALQKDRLFTKELRTKTRAGIRDALAWIQQNYDISKDPSGSAGSAKRSSHVDSGELYHHHWLQALSRLAIHARMRFVGAHDWYQEGAEELIKTQKPDGSWDAIWWSNCYSMLFLLRASFASAVPVVTQSDK